jgi:hypothetical protein
MNDALAIGRPVGVRVLDRVAVVVEGFVVAAIAFNIVMTFTNTMLRYITNQDFPWSTDAWAILISIITFLGAPCYFRRTTGMAYTALIDQTDGLKKQSLQASGLAIFLGVWWPSSPTRPFRGPARPDAGGAGISTGSSGSGSASDSCCCDYTVESLRRLAPARP